MNQLSRYQKIVIGLITFAMAGSFLLYGTANQYSNQATASNQALGKTIDGQTLYEQDLNMMIQFLSAEYNRPNRYGQTNPFNDGVISKDIIGNQVASILFKGFAQEIGDGLVQKINKLQMYRHYEHPFIPEVNAEAVLKYFSPDLHKKLIAFQNSTLPDSERLEQYCELWMQSTDLDEHTLRQVLSMQMQSMGQGAVDPSLYSRNLNILGLKSIEEWFGASFVSLSAQYIDNLARYAQSKGYDIPQEAVKADLLLMVGQRFPKLKKSELKKEFQKLLQSSPYSERSLLKIWKKVLIARMMVENISNSVVIDRNLYSDFLKYAATKADIEFYKLPNSLDQMTESHAQKLFTYLKRVGLGPDPKVLAKFDVKLPDIEEKHPELIKRSVEVTLKRLPFTKAILALSRQELMQYQTAKHVFAEISKNHKTLAQATALTEDEKAMLIESLPIKEHEQLDLQALKVYMKEHPNWIYTQLVSVKPVKETWELPLKGKNEYLGQDTLADNSKLLAKLLDQQQLQNKADNSLFVESEEGIVMLDVDQISDKKLMTFQEAMSQGALLHVDDSVSKRQADLLLHQFLKLAKQEITQDKSSEKKWLSDSQGDPLKNQFLLSKDHVTIRKSVKSDAGLLGSDLFRMKSNEWAPVANYSYGLGFFVANSISIDEDQKHKCYKQIKDQLARQAIHNFVCDFVDELASNHIVVLGKQKQN